MRIMIDAGHGGKDPGAVGNGLREKDIVLTLAIEIGNLLEARGAQVSYTRTDDRFIELSDRAKAANQAKVDYFISLHINAGGGVGFESFIYTGLSGAAAAYRNVIHRQIASVYAQEGLPDRGQKSANFAVLRETNMPAVLFEYGFIDNARDAAKLKDPAWLNKLARATVYGIAEAFGLSDKPAPAPVPEWRKEFDAARKWAMDRGITDGERPTDTLTREEFWTTLYRLHK